VSQIDLVPTLSLLLDQPIPFSNLGTIIPHFFQGSHQHFLPSYLRQIPEGRKRDLAPKLFQQINAAYVSFLNTKQLLTFIEQYQSVSKDLPVSKIEAARNTFEFLEEKFEEYLREVLLMDFINATTSERQIVNVEESIQELHNIHESFQEVLMDVKSTCRSVWAKFDVMSMTMGISLMAFIAFFVLTSPHFFNFNSLNDTGWVFTLVCVTGLSFCGVAIFFSVIDSEEIEKDSMIVFIALSFSFSLWLLSINVIPSFSSVKIKLNQFLTSRNIFNNRWFFFGLCFFVQNISYFSNSYIIHEDTVTLFLCQTFVMISAATFFLEMIINAKDSSIAHHGKSKVFLLLKTRFVRTFVSNLFVFGIFSIVLLGFRVTKSFWFCREMQLKCSLSSYALPLVSLMSEFTSGHVHERLFVAIVSLIIIVLSTNLYLKKQGNVKGKTPSAVFVNYVSIIMIAMIIIHWCLQIMLTHPISKLFDVHSVQQIILPRIVYILFLLSTIILIIQPLPIFVYRKEKNSSNETINRLYHQIKNNFNAGLEKSEVVDNTQVIVYGLKTAYSSAIIVLLYMLVLVTCMIMMDGMALPMWCLWTAGFGISKTFAIPRRRNSTGMMCASRPAAANFFLITSKIIMLLI